MRRLSRKKAANLVKELDAFPKVPESYVETTASGGTVSLIAFSAMALLAFFEFFVYRETWMKYDYEVDKDFSSKLRINIDITVAMKCQFVGADVLDLAETMVASDGLQYEPVVFELSPQQRLWHRTLLLIQNRLREEHALQDVLFKSVLKGAPTALPPREEDPDQPLSSCRIHGHLYVNKVAGNFHITVGKAIPHPRGHAHLAALVSHDNNQMFQYFITIVPTKLQTHKISAETHQYSVTERERVINHAAGSHGVSGIFMKYDISSLMVTVTEQHMPLWQFLVRLCGIIGGIFSTTGMLHGLVSFLVDVVCCRFKLGVYKPKEVRLQKIPFLSDFSADNPRVHKIQQNKRPSKAV
uniref:Endoplasmic reticulum-Golgi intermediate compartment protein n=1 Tax=Denticeps clupeoides TaxID=299321 RepID=A0AAY4B179_9TELE